MSRTTAMRSSIDGPTHLMVAKKPNPEEIDFRRIRPFPGVMAITSECRDDWYFFREKGEKQTSPGSTFLSPAPLLDPL